eukprot:6908011-Lingulodinium_polyedra.AAC.1
MRRPPRVNSPALSPSFLGYRALGHAALGRWAPPLPPRLLRLSPGCPSRARSPTLVITSAITTCYPAQRAHR